MWTKSTILYCKFYNNIKCVNDVVKNELNIDSYYSLDNIFIETQSVFTLDLKTFNGLCVNYEYGFIFTFESGPTDIMIKNK